jgi:hypothetical protein
MKRHMIKLLVIAVIMFAATSAFADYSYNFDVNTSTISGPGYLELTFSPGSYTGAASAVTSNFTFDGTLAGAPQLTGAVAGALPGSVTINNTTSWNDYYQQVDFGNNIKFTLNLSGATAGNSFGLSFWGADGITPLLSNDAVNGFASTVALGQSGDVTLTDYSSGQVTVQGGVTPIPAAAWLLGSGLMGLAGIRRKMAA